MANENNISSLPSGYWADLPVDMEHVNFCIHKNILTFRIDDLKSLEMFHARLYSLGIGIRELIRKEKEKTNETKIDSCNATSNDEICSPTVEG